MFVERTLLGPASSSFHPSGLTPGRSEWPRRMKGRTKPDQLVNAQNKNSGFVVQIPEGLYVNSQNNIQFHPLIETSGPVLAGSRRGENQVASVRAFCRAGLHPPRRRCTEHVRLPRIHSLLRPQSQRSVQAEEEDVNQKAAVEVEGSEILVSLDAVDSD